MTPQQARTVAAALMAAADKAEAQGSDQVETLAELRALDDAARADLAAAIKDAGG